jgi:MoxR-like ATPase
MQPNRKQQRPRVESLVQQLQAGLQERDETVAVALLGTLAGQNTFLLGPPGTAKSLLARRLSAVFEDASYFESLLHRFSTPEDLFGAISIKALKEDRQHRKTAGYLPSADVAFLDEIWKSSPAILNTLLTIINERVFRNGESVEAVPLKALVAASNEVPGAGQGLDALFDRFLIRLHVPPLKQVDSFLALLNDQPSAQPFAIAPEDRVTMSEWQTWPERIAEVKLSPETLNVVRFIRSELAQRQSELSLYVSDRRWQRAANLMRAAAFFCDRDATNLADALILRHCLWSDIGHREAVANIVERAIEQCGLATEQDLAALDAEKERLEQEIQGELFHTADVYKSVRIGQIECFEVPGYNETVFIPVSKLKSSGSFHPLDRRGNVADHVECTFDKQGACRLHGLRGVDHFTPDVILSKGDKKEQVNRRLVGALAASVGELQQKLKAEHELQSARKKKYLQALSSPFVPAPITALAATAVEKQLDDLSLRIKDCDRLRALAQ